MVIKTYLSITIAVLALWTSAAPANSGSPSQPVIVLIGDSTVTANKGWGGAFARALSGRASVHNFAVGGRSAKSFTDEDRLPAALASNPDYVFMQFGHNGQPGKGPERETDPKGDYRDYLRAFVAAIRAAGAEPIIVTSMTRRNFDDEGNIRTTLGPWADAARAVAREDGATLVDLHAASKNYHNSIGDARGLRLDFAPGDRTHLNRLGASVVTGLIFDELSRVGHPLVSLRPTTVQVGTCRNTTAGPPCFTTIDEALGLAPASGSSNFTIELDAGKFVEKLVVDKPSVTLQGSGQDASIISFGDSGESLGPDGHPVGTWGSFTLKVAAPDFAAYDLTIENDFDFAANHALHDSDPNKIRSTQGVALMLADGSDRAVFERVTFSGNQDTLFVDAGRSYFRNVSINGHVDFVFGAGQAVFERAIIASRNRVDKNPTGYVIAPSTHIGHPFGFLFLDCKLVRHDPDVPAGTVKLGRPWHPNSDLEVNGAAVFHNCFMDDHIADDGYARISGAQKDGTRMWFDLEPDSRMFEYRSHGPGAKAGPRRPQLSDDAARYYTRENVLGDWAPWELLPDKR